MAIDQKHIGRKYGPFKYEVGLEKMRDFAITVAGGVKCWGNNVGGGLGDGTAVQRNAPVDVIGLATVVGPAARVPHALKPNSGRCPA